ncbi:pantoate--beta-alanine ligase [Sphingomonas sp. LY160]|uniref:pantoate--beta-alanine ligase n=1 Tax=Sphingomonas sp. LY160 TaxID=3095342 RepID=UPI002ADEB206|nr:pantoate--beta-alanine ligase [Sphingomonas sp. LY160]MEA1072740.1 pantoate--beta-alanine ligase [Sphingomonas sp. LY160]
MQIVRELSDLAAALAPWRANGETIALVPTMGALHAGHLALIAEARTRANRVVATIFVNPLQFAPTDDLDRYPRREAEDAALLEEAGCDLLWTPTATELYPDGFATTVHVAGVSERWDGAARPGHFDGVATVVAKLFLTVRPTIAIFGEKDFQQLAVIRRMERDLGIGIAIHGVETVRDADGLALSSRNAYLSADERKRALALPMALEQARCEISDGEPVGEVLDVARQSLRDAGFERIDYVALVDAATLEPVRTAEGEMRLLAAAVIGTTRLIDNIRVVSATVSN